MGNATCCETRQEMQKEIEIMGVKDERRGSESEIISDNPRQCWKNPEIPDNETMTGRAVGWV